MNEHVAIASPVSKTTRAAEGLDRRCWSVAEIEAMVSAGILAEDERFELIGGEVVPTSPKGPYHEWIKIELNRFWQRAAPDHLQIAPETTLWLDEYTFVEPDFWVHARVAGPRKTTGADMLLAIEVADSSLAYDLGRKIGVYAAYGVPEVWVIDARTLVTRVHRALGAAGYAEIVNIPHDQPLVSILAPELAVTLREIGLEPAHEQA